MLKKIWRKIDFWLYCHLTTYGVQWYGNTRIDTNCREDKTFYSLKNAEIFYNECVDRVTSDELIVLWKIEKSNYKDVLRSRNY